MKEKEGMIVLYFKKTAAADDHGSRSFMSTMMARLLNDLEYHESHSMMVVSVDLRCSCVVREAILCSREKAT